MLNAKPRDLKTRLLAAQWAFDNGTTDPAEKQATAALQLDPQLVGGPGSSRLDRPVPEELQGGRGILPEGPPVEAEPLQPAATTLPWPWSSKTNEEKKQRALEYAENNVRKYGKSNQASEAYSTYGWVLYKMDRLDDAEKVPPHRDLRRCLQRRYGVLSTPACWPNVADTTKTPSNCSTMALKNAAPFAYRDDAKQLLDELKK